MSAGSGLGSGAAAAHLRVIFGDTDAAGIVYYGTYLRYFEAARGELLRAHGVPLKALLDRGLRLPIVDVQVRYLRPLRYDDEIVVWAWAESLRGARIVMEHRIERGGEIMAECRCTLALTDADGRPRRLPPELLALREASGG